MFSGDDPDQVKDESNQVRYKAVFFLFHVLKDYSTDITDTFIKNNYYDKN